MTTLLLLSFGALVAAGVFVAWALRRARNGAQAAVPVASAPAREGGKARGTFRIAATPGELRTYEAVVGAAGKGKGASVAVSGRDVTGALQRRVQVHFLDPRRSRVLLVDHDPALVAIVSRLLAARGHDVIAAASAMEARQQAASFPGAVDVVVTGLDLGDEHGVSVLGEVRRTSPGARAVLVSGEVANDGDVAPLLEAGVELVRRPVPAEALVAAVERAAARVPTRRDPVRA
ncbi:MAG: response regulator [Anaeromyxobacteraceae bacterium]